MRVASLLAVAVLYTARPAEAAGVAKLAVSSIATPQSAGSVSSVRVEARTSSGALVTTYSGTIRFTSSDSRAVLPANYTFTTADQGAHVFTNGVTLKTAGTQSVSATDATPPSITGTQTGIVVNPGPAATLVFSGIATPRTAGDFATMTVELLDTLANRASGYRGTVHFGFGAPTGSFPVDYTFTAADAGMHTFTNGLNISTAGTWTITVTDTANPALTGAQTVQVNPGPAAQLIVNGVASPTTSGLATSATVEVQDQFRNRATGYGGTVRFSSSDGQAVLPGDFRFTSADAGIHSFSGLVTLKTVGVQTVTVTDTVTASLTSTQSGIQVVSNDPVTLSVSGLPFPPFGTSTAGSVRTITVSARDAARNPSQGYTGTVHFTATDGEAVLPADYTFTSGAQCGPVSCDNGLHQFSVTFRTSCRGENCIGSLFAPSKIQTITAQDTLPTSLKGSTSTSVTPADAAVIAVFGFPSVVAAGDVQSFVLQAQDVYGNVVDRPGNATVTFSDPQVPPMTVPISPILQQWATWLLTPGLQSIRATDGILPALPQTGISVVPGPAFALLLSGIASPVSAGSPATLVVEAVDWVGNRSPDYAGTVAFTSTDPQAILPSTVSFAGAGGVKTFQDGVTLRTAGTQSVIAVDTMDGTITGSFEGIAVNAAGATSFAVAVSPSTGLTAGFPVQASVAALDPYGNVDTAYSGTVHFTSSDPFAVLPADLTFVPADIGVATVSGVTFKTAGLQSLSAADALSPSLNGTQTGIRVVAAGPASLMVSGLVFPLAGAPGSVTVTALDVFGNVATGYVGTVGFTSSDPQAVLPTATAFSAADAGTRPFVVTLKTAGSQSVTATDTVSPGLTGTRGGISVAPAGAASFVVTGVASPIEGGAPTSVTIDARDAYGNRATGYLGTVAFASSDLQAILPPPYAFVASDSGLHTFAGAVRFATAGTQSITATDTAVSTIKGTQTGIAVSDSFAPVWPAGSSLSGTGTSTTTARLVWTAATDNVGVTAYRLYQNGTLVQALGGSTLTTDVSGLTIGVATFFQIQAGDAAGHWTTNGPTASVATVPPDPVLVAPPIDTSVSTNTYDASSFIYSGPNPIQTGVAPGTIQPTQVAVLRGTVHDRAGQPLSAVRISAVGRPEFGQTFTRADGAFDFAVNGGGLTTVKYERADLLPAQRQVTPDWQDYTTIPDVVLVPQDQLVSVIDMGSANTQVARGSVSTDDIGSRQATVIFPPGTGATLKMPDGSTQTVGTLHVRATELTVGPNGPAAMPGPLPPSSAYTYAAALTADEALEAGATSIQFSQPVYGYLENFLGFPVGFVIPSASYDTAGGRWVPESNGKVVQVVSVTNGFADLDTNGDGVPDDATTLANLGVSNAELAQLATLYQPGQSIWRVPLQHFSFVDWNVPLGIIDNLIRPLLSLFTAPPDPCSGTKSKCILEVQNQILGESLPIVGTPYHLYYNSGRVPGRRANYRLDVTMPIPKTFDISRAITLCLPGRTPECQRVTPATSKIRIDGTVTIRIGGRTFVRSTDATIDPVDVSPGQWRFQWDGKDAYGRVLQGEQPVSVTSCYNYPGVSYSTPEENAISFGQPGLNGAITVFRYVSPFSAVFDVCTSAKRSIGSWSMKPAGLGGWTLSAQHMLDVPNRTIYRGDGGIQRVDDLNRYLIDYVAGTGRAGLDGQGRGLPVSDGVPATTVDLDGPNGLAIGPDGSIYVSEPPRGIISRVTPDGTYHIFAGKLLGGGSDADGVLASQANLRWPAGLALAADGTLYYVDSNLSRIRKVTPDGRIFTVVGSGPLGASFNFSPDGTPALSATLALDSRGSIALAPDGTLYFAEKTNHRVRKVRPDGILRTAAGSGPAPDPQGFGGLSGDGGPALQARLSRPEGVALGPDGSLYIADSCNQRVRKVTPDGIIATVAGSGGNCQLQNPRFGGDGGPATNAGLGFQVFSLAVASDSTLFIGQFSNGTIRRVTPLGTINTVAGTGALQDAFGGTAGCKGNNCPAPATPLGNTQEVAIGPAEELYVGMVNTMQRVGRLSTASTKQGVKITNIVVPSSDASEVYVFDSRGRHLRTLDALTNVQLQLFGYDSAGRLVSIADRDGNVTTVQRDAQGNPTALLSPHSQQTTVAVDSDGYLRTVTNPNSESVKLLYRPGVAGDPHTGGLLTQLTDARGGLSINEYDSDGFFTNGTRADGSFVTLDRGGALAPTSVTYRTALGRTETYGISQSPTGDTETRTSRDPAGLLTSVNRNPDKSTSVTQPDGTSITTTVIPDPRFGIQAATASTTTRTPSGLTRTVTRSRTVSLSNPNDPLSLTSLIEQVTVNGRTSRSTYDAATKTITQTTPMGRQTVSSFDSLGRMIQTQSPGTVPATIDYDLQGHPQTISQGSRVIALSYRPDGFLGNVSDPLLQSTTFGYDLAGRSTNTTLPNSTTIGATYDANGNVTSLTPPSRPAYEFTYTAANRERDYIRPDVGQPRITSTDYNLDQQVTNVSRPDGDFIVPTFDPPTGRLSALATRRGTNSYAYNPSTGQLMSVTTFDGVGVAYGYDGPLVKDVTWSGPVSGNVHKTYDSNFRLSTETVTGGQTINFGYDSDDQLTSAGAMTITRDPTTGLVTSAELGAIHEGRTYDVFGAEKTYTVTANGTTVYSVDYGTRDALGRIVHKTETIQGGTHAYGYAYDVDGRLTDVTKDGVATSHYDYDPNGNRLAGPGLTTPPAYDNQDRLLSYGNCAYTYRNDGALQTKACSDGTTTYEYDPFGNLRGVTLPNGTTISYVIDGQNRRVGKKVNGTMVESFVFENALKRVGWYNGTGALKAQFVFGARAGVPDLMIKDGSTYRLVSDQIGTVRLVLDSSGAVVERLDPDEFGNTLSDSTPRFQPFGFAGGLRDIDTGLVRFGSRDYDSAIGRWVTADELRFGGGDTNLYRYVVGDPVNRMDPTGFRDTSPGVLGTLVRICLFDPILCASGGGFLIGFCLANPEACGIGLAPSPAPSPPPMCGGRPPPTYNRCLDACASTESLREEFCRAMKEYGFADEDVRVCWSKVKESEQECRHWCANIFAN